MHKTFTDDEMTSFECQGCRLCHNVSGKCQMIRSIGSIGQARLRSDKNFTNGEMTSFER
jgi:MinD superfamily P-loop ATPase